MIRRVMFLTPSVRALGARRSLIELIRALPPEIEPFVICPGNDGITLELKDLGVPTAFAPQGAWRKIGGRMTAILKQIPAMRAALSSFQPDMVHANEFHIVPQAYYSGRRKYPLTAHVRLSITPRQIRNYHLNDCTGIAVVSEAVRGLFWKSPCFPRVETIHNGVNLGNLKEIETSSEAIDRWLQEIGEPKPLVAGLFGLVSERKNQLLAVEAVELANSMGAKVALLLAGDAFKGSLAYGEELGKRLEGSKNVLWLPFQKEVAPLYRAIDVNLLISNEEGFGRTIIEAGAVGKPSIGTLVGGIPEIIERDRTGFLVAEGDAKGLAEHLVQLWRDRTNVERMGAAARERVESHFTIEAHTAAMIRFWEKAQEAHKQGTHLAPRK